MKDIRKYLRKYPAVYIVYDSHVQEYVEMICCRSKNIRTTMPIEATEDNKTMDTVMSICKWLLENEADRDSLLLAVGGGVTTDIAGFAAGIYKRGIPFANVPTTLLSQVDAAYGGKTGVNLNSYKNMLGVIRQPDFVYIWPETLHSLPDKEISAGMAEMLKTFIIKDDLLYEDAVQTIRDNADLTPFIEKAGKIKEKIARKDPFEKGKRRLLNLGHTYGHAIEWYQHYHNFENPYNHGEAVAIGIIQAARISERMGVAKPGLTEKLIEDFKACGLPTSLPCPEEELEAAIRRDKKIGKGKLNFVMIKRIGKVVIKRI